MGMSELTKDVRKMSGIAKKFNELSLTSQAYTIEALIAEHNKNKRAEWDSQNAATVSPMTGPAKTDAAQMTAQN